MAGAALRFDRELWRAKLGPLLEQWKNLTERHPALTNANKPPQETKPRNNNTTSSEDESVLDPIVGFVAMENEIASAITCMVSASLAQLKKVVYGTLLLTPAIQAVAAALIAGRVPGVWAKKWEGPEKPTVWIAALARKASSLATWASKAHNGSLLDEPLDLSEVFRPLTFLNALRQLTARKAQCPMDALTLVTAWQAARVNSPHVIVCHGLLLQGAELQGTTLIEANSDATEIVQVPPLALGYSPHKQDLANDQLQVPLYHDTTREQLLVEIALPIKEDADIWILAGVALFLIDIM